jgi:hypothetical protein
MAAVAAIQHALHERGDEASFKRVNVNTISCAVGGRRPMPGESPGQCRRAW